MRMRNVKNLWSITVLSFVILAFSARSSAWSGAGHEVIATLAWRELSAETKTNVTELLRNHPDYEKWQASYSGDSGVDLPAFIFMRASIWADEIRRHGSPYDHPHWHSVNYPLEPPAFPMEAGPKPNDDALYGIGQCEKFLSDAKAPPQERAVYLAWVIHLISDLHQPLHCASLFNNNFPLGDKGGNDLYIKPGASGINLHTFWDGLLGTSGDVHSQVNYAVQIQSEHPRKSLNELKTAKTPREWSLEGRGVAIEKAYLHGKLNGSTRADIALPLPEGYSREAKAVAEKQAALAGYRLADKIQQYVR